MLAVQARYLSPGTYCRAGIFRVFFFFSPLLSFRPGLAWVVNHSPGPVAQPVVAGHPSLSPPEPGQPLLPVPPHQAGAARVRLVLPGVPHPPTPLPAGLQVLAVAAPPTHCGVPRLVAVLGNIWLRPQSVIGVLRPGEVRRRWLWL